MCVAHMNGNKKKNDNKKNTNLDKILEKIKTIIFSLKKIIIYIYFYRRLINPNLIFTIHE